MPQDAQVQEYSDYFQLTWLNGNFRLQMLNYFSYAGPRTINHQVGTIESRKLQENHTQIFMN